MSLIRPQGTNRRFKKTKLGMKKESLIFVGEEALENYIKPDGKTPHYFIYEDESAYMDFKPFTLEQARKQFGDPEEEE